MICSNCGAEIDDNSVVCPYCGYENEAKAAGEQRDTVEHYHEMAKEAGQLKEKTARRAAHRVNRTAAVLFGLGAVILLIVFAVTAFRSMNGLNRQKKQLETCEKYYQSEDYTGLGEYLDEHELHSYGRTFEKYERAADLAEDYDLDIQLVGDYLSRTDSAYFLPEEIAKELRYIFGTMRKIRDYEEEGFRFGEEEAVTHFKELYDQMLRDDLCMTEEEIDDYTENSSDDWQQEDYEELAGELMDRMRAGQY